MLPIYKIELGENEGITKMSLVRMPAVESNFIALSKQEMKFSVDEEEHNVFGVALRANFPIYRVSDYGEYYVLFDEDVIKKLYQKFMISYRDKVNLEHSDDVDGVYLIQSFIKDDYLQPKGFEDIENGSWFVMYHIDNDEVWQKVKEGDFRGFSVECTVDLSDEPMDEMEILINDLIN